MDLELIPNVPTRSQIDRLQSEMMTMPQAEVVTDHWFVPGMYCRRVFRKKDTLIVGKVHKAAHFFLCLSGEIIVWTEKGMRTIIAGDVIESKPGTKRATYALQDSVGITVHKTELTDLAEIEKELIEPDETALFDALNQVKELLIEAEKGRVTA